MSLATKNAHDLNALRENIAEWTEFKYAKAKRMCACGGFQDRVRLSEIGKPISIQYTYTLCRNCDAVSSIRVSVDSRFLSYRR